MWIFEVIKWFRDALAWALDNAWYVLVALAFLFAPVLRKTYNGIKQGILSLVSYEGIISIIISIILFLILFSKIGLIKW